MGKMNDRTDVRMKEIMNKRKKKEEVLFGQHNLDPPELSAFSRTFDSIILKFCI